MLDKDDRVIVPDRGDQSTLRVMRVGRGRDLQPGDMHKHRMQALGVLRPLPPGLADHAAHDHRHSNCSVFHVYRGEGHSVVDGVRIDWHEGDFFALPPWCWHEHANTGDEEAVLFSITDLPAMEALDLYREEPYAEHDGHQPVA